MPAFNAPDIDAAAPDSLPHPRTRPGAAHGCLRQPTDVA